MGKKNLSGFFESSRRTTRNDRGSGTNKALSNALESHPSGHRHLHPEEENWYLPAIGVDPIASGRDTGLLSIGDNGLTL